MSWAARAFIVAPLPPGQDLARRLASGTGGLSRLRGNARATSTGHDKSQADGHALLR
jgi:hypothetical protein